MASTIQSVIIIGGGIGGLAAAVAMRQRGINVQVFEAAPELKPIGKGIWVPPNAMQVMERLGLAGELSRAGWPLTRIEVSNGGGPPLLQVDLLKYKAIFGHTICSIHRADLVRVLAAGLNDVLQLGKRCVRIDGSTGDLVAHFADGTKARADAIVAADGIRSPIRKQFFGPATYRYSGQTCYRGIADLELPPESASVCKEIWGGDARIGFSAIGPRQVYWFAPMLAPPDSPQLQSGELSAFLLRQYESFPSPIRSILEHTPPETIIRTDLYDIAPLNCWHRDGVVLLGDAAHAMTPNLGQGGAQAIEDAYVLAECLHRCRTAEEAFVQYERRRMKKAHKVAKAARRVGAMAHLRGGIRGRIRDFVLRATPQRVSDRSVTDMLHLDY